VLRKQHFAAIILGFLMKKLGFGAPLTVFVSPFPNSSKKLCEN